jgi:hypothetical protein
MDNEAFLKVGGFELKQSPNGGVTLIVDGNEVNTYDGVAIMLDANDDSATIKLKHPRFSR